MKNRRLNILFIAIIALAAAPQALHDAYRLVNAVQERAESEFWSVFLSYQMPESNGGERGGVRVLPAAGGGQQDEGACPLERIASRSMEAPRASRSNTAARARALSAEAKPAATKDDSDEAEEIASDDADEVASAEGVPAISLPEREQKALRSSTPHARDAEKMADAASRASLASFIENNEELQLKVKQMKDMDKLLRRRTPGLRGPVESFNTIPAPNTVGSM
jgi:hypothetical protein